jgi:hypothetical protein
MKSSQPPSAIAQDLFQRHWMDDGRLWRDHLPWVRRMNEYKARPWCSVEKDWFKLAAKKLRALAVSASTSETDLVWLSFDAEILRIAVGGETVIVPATGTAWDARVCYQGKTT